jgi:hypothetical protein
MFTWQLESNFSSTKVPEDLKESKVNLIKNFRCNLVTGAGTLLELSERGFNGCKSLLPTTLPMEFYVTL